MNVTIDVPDLTMEKLNVQAQEQGRSVAELVLDLVVAQFEDGTEDEDLSLDDETVECIQRGIEQTKAGQAIPLEQARAEFKAAFAARHGGVVSS